MKKILILVLLLFSHLFAQNEFRKFKTSYSNYNRFISDTTITPVVGDDTSAVDGFDTPILITQIYPNILKLTWYPGEIDSTDISSMRLYYAVTNGTAGNFNHPNGYSQIWSVASADSVDTLSFNLDIGGNITVTDTSANITVYAVLYDSSGNSRITGTVLDTLAVRNQVVSTTLFDTITYISSTGTYTMILAESLITNDFYNDSSYYLIMHIQDFAYRTGINDCELNNYSDYVEGNLIVSGDSLNRIRAGCGDVPVSGDTLYIKGAYLLEVETTTDKYITNYFLNGRASPYCVYPDLIPPVAASVFTLTSADSGHCLITSSGVPADMDSFRINIATGTYPPTQTAGTLLLAGNLASQFNNDNIVVDLIGNTNYYGCLWMADNLGNWQLYATVNKSTFLTEPNTDPPIPALEFTLSSPDTTHVRVISSGIPANADSFRVNFSLTAYPLTRTAGTLLIAGKNFSAINNDLITADLTDNEIYYGKLWMRTVWDSWISYANANSDTFLVTDIIPPAQATSITATENDTDSVNVVINYGAAEHDSIRVQWNDSTITSRTYGTNIYAGHVATTTIRFKHGVTNETELFIRVYLMDDAGNWNTGLQTSLWIADYWAPIAGTLDLNIFVPDYDDSTYVTNSVSTDLAYFEYYAGTRDAALNIIFQNNLATVQTPQDTLLNLSGKVSYVGNDTLFLFGYWWDDADNHSVAMDSIFPTSTQYIVNMIIDTARIALDSLVFGIGSTANSGEMNWDMRIGINDTLVGEFGDTIKVDLPDTLITQFEIAHVRTVLRFTSGMSEDTSDAVQYPGIYTGGTITFYGRTKN